MSEQNKDYHIVKHQGTYFDGKTTKKNKFLVEIEKVRTWTSNSTNNLFDGTGIQAYTTKIKEVDNKINAHRFEFKNLNGTPVSHKTDKVKTKLPR